MSCLGLWVINDHWVKSRLFIALQTGLMQNFINDLYKGTKLVLRYDLRLLGATAIHLGLATLKSKLPAWNHDIVRPHHLSKHMSTCVLCISNVHPLQCRANSVKQHEAIFMPLMYKEFLCRCP